jgi:hypothetical protein
MAERSERSTTHILVLAALAALAALACGAASAGPSMSLHASGNITCGAQAAPASCSASYVPGDPEAGAFQLSVDADAIPDGGYTAITLEVALGGLAYEPRAQCPDSVVWPSMTLVDFPPCSIDEQPGRLRIHAQSDDVVPPTSISRFTGKLVELDVRCPGPGLHTVALLTPGTSYADADLENLPLKAAGTRQIDLDGDTEAEGAQTVDALTVTCEGPAT